jgi:hypothetical protein
MVSGHDRGHLGADLEHYTRTLVPSDAGQPERHITSDDVLIRVAQAGRVQFDEHLLRPRRIEFDRLDRPLPFTLP